MSRTVHKFGPLFPNQLSKIFLPQYSKVVHFGEKDGHIWMWVELEKGEPGQNQEYFVYGTGWDIDEGFKHQGTTIVDGFVWHLYKRV